MPEIENPRKAKKGDKFIVVTDLPLVGLSSWDSAYTGSFNCILPRGTILVTLDDQLESAPGFAVQPEQYTNIETLVVPHEDRSHPKYSGYYFVLRSDDIGKSIENLEENSREICTEKDL